jgi:acyl-ACP thioesterase
LVGIRFRIGDESFAPLLIPMQAFMGLLAHQAGDNWITRAGDESTYFPAMASEDEMVPLPTIGRRYGTTRRVRLGDASPRGRLRLDAIARYLQDVANDDAHDSGIANPGGWVVRRTTVQVSAEVAFRELVEVTTFCSGIGKRWAERRTIIAGDAGGRVDTASLWVQIDMASGKPTSLAEDFRAVYGPSAGGRSISARLHHGDPPAAGDERAELVFPLRFADFDVMGHVNNAVYWAVLEEALRGRWDRRGPFRAEVEHRRPIDAGDAVTVTLARLDGGTPGAPAAVGVWMADAVGLAATGWVRSGPGR